MRDSWILISEADGTWRWVCRKSDGGLVKSATSFPSEIAMMGDAKKAGWTADAQQSRIDDGAGPSTRRPAATGQRLEGRDDAAEEIGYSEVGVAGLSGIAMQRRPIP